MPSPKTCASSSLQDVVGGLVQEFLEMLGDGEARLFKSVLYIWVYRCDKNLISSTHLDPGAGTHEKASIASLPNPQKMGCNPVRGAINIIHTTNENPFYNKEFQNVSYWGEGVSQ